jgi:hypothetical protein
MKLKNRDLVYVGVVAIFLVAIYAMMRRNPAGGLDRKPPEPINQYTSGAISNGMDVMSRMNFHQQPVGGNFS